ncbi:MAG: N,N-dimethylformamidase beta subunit family domain-containing protein [Limisphaerales bacterium]
MPLLPILLVLFSLTLHAEQLKPLFIEGYAGKVSYIAGDEITFHISTTAAVFSIEVTRLGGTNIAVLKTNNVPGREHSIPENASTHGCDWPASFSFKLPVDWRTGYYEVRLRAEDRGGSYTHKGRRTAESDFFFIVRRSISDTTTRSKILLQLASNTYNAYNNWGGLSLYSFNARAKVQGHRVSFLRPPSSQFNNWERPFVEWAERNGYQLDFCANLDLEEHPELLRNYKLVLSVGHDEYWSAGMRDHLEKFISDGGNVAFFSGNSVCWQVRPEDNGTALTSWKQWYNLDPVFPSGDHKLLSTAWSHHLVKRPENELTGVGFLWGGYHKSHGQFMDGKGAYTVHRPEHWLFEGTSLKRNDDFGSKDTIVGYECDGCEMTMRDGLPYPTGRDGTPTNFVILATAPAKWHPDDAYWYERFAQGRVGAAVLGTYTRGGTVVTCGSTDWAHGLRGKDATVERITRNVLDRLSR